MGIQERKAQSHCQDDSQDNRVEMHAEKLKAFLLRKKWKFKTFVCVISYYHYCNAWTLIIGVLNHNQIITGSFLWNFSLVSTGIGSHHYIILHNYNEREYFLYINLYVIHAHSHHFLHDVNIYTDTIIIINYNYIL